MRNRFIIKGITGFLLMLIGLTATMLLHAQDCGQAIVTNAWFAKHPQAKNNYDNLQAQIKQLENSISNNASRDSGTAYRIPVVFHILHQNGPENISDEQIYDQMAILNRDYNKQNEDTAVIDSAYKNNIANVGFTFELAKIDPDGHCTNGITRHYTSKTNWDAANLDDFTYTWPPSQYLNIYVVTKLSINATAYSFLPGIGIPDSADVIVMTHKMCGSIGTATVANSRVLTHEVAHWFDVAHTWGSSNAPGVACGDDGINDTPITKGFSTCNLAHCNVCDTNIRENVQNYMDYSPCKIMFTNGQAMRMKATIASGINGRDNVITENNLQATGLSGTIPCTTRADFYVTKTTTCEGGSFTFTSLSQFGNSTNNSLQWNFTGGIASSLTDSVVTVTYPFPGQYNVALTATGSNGQHTETRYNIVNVIAGNNGPVPPFTYGFEDATLPAGIAVFNEQGDSIQWNINTSTGANNTSQCIFLHNYPDSTNYGNRDYFETGYFNFSNISASTLSYYYAYAKRYTAQADSFWVMYSTDCGGSWSKIVSASNTTVMANNSGGLVTGAFTPTQAQWKKVSIPASQLTAINNKPSVKFRFFFKADYMVDGSNNIYIDEINLNGTVISDIEELTKDINAKIYPNPANGTTTLQFTAPYTGTAIISVTDLAGRLHQQHTVQVASGNQIQQLLNRQNTLPAGIYMVTITTGGIRQSQKLIITN